MRSSATWLATLVLLAALLSTGSAPAQESSRVATAAGRTVWPRDEWIIATPESQGLSGAALDTAAAYAAKHGGGSGCVIRRGYLVKEWGDPNKLADTYEKETGTAGVSSPESSSAPQPGRPTFPASCPITRSTGAAMAVAHSAVSRPMRTGRLVWAIASLLSARAWMSWPCGWASGL
jgi:hypothetical protein